MHRLEAIDALYQRIDMMMVRYGCHKLASCHSGMQWPAGGVYFFFQDEEFRGNSTKKRVVRVGTHAITATAKSTFWSRIKAHQGTRNGGNHRASVFRKRVGLAWLNREGLLEQYPHWGIGNNGNAEIRKQEAAIEQEVSRILGAMSFTFIPVPKMDDQRRKDRSLIEKGCINILSNKSRTPQVDRPSEHWLGLSDVKRTQRKSVPYHDVRDSGLWNSDFVDIPFDAQLAKNTLTRIAQIMEN